MILVKATHLSVETLKKTNMWLKEKTLLETSRASELQNLINTLKSEILQLQTFLAEKDTAIACLKGEKEKVIKLEFLTQSKRIHYCLRSSRKAVKNSKLRRILYFYNFQV